MVSLTNVQSSNSRIASALPPDLVAVFVGGTSGVGEATLKQFAKHVRQPRIYFVGRSKEAGDRIARECQQLNPAGKYIFLQADTSLIRTVDDVCREIKSKEKAINLLFLSTGTLSSGGKTAEGLHFAAAVTYYSRTRFIVNLLPLLQQATAVRRVIHVFSGGKEGPVVTSDFQAWKIPVLSVRGHMASMITLSLEALAKKAPTVSFIHDFPGAVNTNIARSGQGVAIAGLKAIFTLIGPFVYVSNQECGERHLFLATSARYPAGTSSDPASGVPLEGVLGLARGTDGENGSGVYTVDSNGDGAGPQVGKLLTRLRTEGMVKKVWQETEEQFQRITEQEMHE